MYIYNNNKTTHHRTIRLAPCMTYSRGCHLCVVVMVTNGGGCKEALNVVTVVCGVLAPGVMVVVVGGGLGLGHQCHVRVVNLKTYLLSARILDDLFIY